MRIFCRRRSRPSKAKSCGAIIAIFGRSSKVEKRETLMKVRPSQSREGGTVDFADLMSCSSMRTASPEKCPDRAKIGRKIHGASIHSKIPNTYFIEKIKIKKENRVFLFRVERERLPAAAPNWRRAAPGERACRLSRPHVDRIESAPQIHDHEMRLYFTTVYYEYTRLEKERNRSEGHNTAAEEQQRRV